MPSLFPSEEVSVLLEDTMGQDPLLTNKHNEDVEAQEEERICRICLDDEEECDNPLIAPCKCKGSQQWVHRRCLDEWRANNTDHIAFSKCTECLTDYRMIYVGPSAGRREYCFYVTRDIGIGVTLTQALMLLLGALVWLCFARSSGGHKTLFGITIKATWGQLFLADIVTGLVMVLILLGIYGSILLCANKCSLERAAEKVEAMADSWQGWAPLHGGSSSDSDAELGGERARTPRHRPMDRGVRGGGAHYYNTVYFCPDCEGESHCCEGNSQCCNNCCISCCPASGDCGGDGDSPILLVILVVVGAVLAAIGLVVGVLLSCALLRGIYARHLFRLQKKRLTQNYVVQDLSGLDDQQRKGMEGLATELPPPVAPPVDGEADIPNKGKTSSKAQPQDGSHRDTPHKDYLRDLGLMDD